MTVRSASSGTPSLVVVGGGRMGTAIVRGLLSAGWVAPGGVAVVEADVSRRADLIRELPGVVVLEVPGEATSLAGAGAIMAVKPYDVEGACGALASTGVIRVLSIAAGVPIGRLESWLPDGLPVVRAMPNTPAQVGAGVSALSGGSAAREIDLAWAEEVLGAVGAVVRVPESSLDAVTGLSGSGPAYVFLVAEALIDAGVRVGLTRPISTTLAIQTLVGAGRLLVETGSAPEELRAQVTSPGGTTAAGLAVLEDREVREAISEAVQAATERSRQLGT